MSKKSQYLMISEKRSLWEKGVVVLTTSVLFFTNVFSIYAGETSFWADRQALAQRVKSSKKETFLPVRGTSKPSYNSYQLLAQLPPTGAVSLGFASSAPVGIAPALSSPPPLSPEINPSSGVQDTPTWISNLLLPYGSVREIFLAKKDNAPLIIHIQDAHGLLEAQQNISSMIQRLAEQRGVTLVGMEGAAGAFTTDRYRSYPNPEITRGLAESFLKEGLLGGPEFSAIVSPIPLTLWGVEDLGLYQDNILAFKDSVKAKNTLNQLLTEANKEVEQRKDKSFSPLLKEFDTHVTAYRSQREGMGSYVRYLNHQANILSVTGQKLPQMGLLLEAMEREQSIDFKEVEKERSHLVRVLVDRIPQRELNALVQRSLLCRMGRVTSGELNQTIQNLCRRHQIPLNQFGPLEDYLNYVTLAEKIIPVELLNEITQVEKAVGLKLSKTAEQKQLMVASRALSIVGKLASQTLTPEEWNSYEMERAPILSSVQGLSAGINGPALEPSERFCRIATGRNTAMTDHLLAKMKVTGTSSAVLVAGGFHSEGLTQVLRNRGISFVVVTPRITEVPQENNYLDIFSNDPLPLEKLFSGEEISLVAPPPTAASTEGPRGFIVPGSFILGHSVLQTLVNSSPQGDSLLSVEEIFKGIEANAERIFHIRVEEFEKDRLSRSGAYTLLKAKLVQKGRAVNCRVIAAPQEKWGNAEKFLQEQGWQDRVVQRKEVLVEGRKYIVVLMELGASTPNSRRIFKDLNGAPLRSMKGVLRESGVAATFHWLEKGIQFVIPDATRDDLILKYAPVIEFGIFGMIYLLLAFVGGPALLGGIPEGIQWLPVLGLSYLITNVVFVLLHTSVYRYFPDRKDSSKGDWVLEKVFWASWAGWRTRLDMLKTSTFRIHWPILLGVLGGLPILLGGSSVLVSGGALSLFVIFSFVVVVRKHKAYNLLAKGRGLPALAFVLKGPLRVKARKDLQLNLSGIKRGAPLALVFGDGRKMEAGYHGSHLSDDGQWIAVQLGTAPHDQRLEFFDLASVKEIHLGDSKKVLFPASVSSPKVDPEEKVDFSLVETLRLLRTEVSLTFAYAESIISGIPDNIATSDKGNEVFEEMVRLPGFELTLALKEALDDPQDFGLKWTFLLAVLEERDRRHPLLLAGDPNREAPHERMPKEWLQALIFNSGLQGTPQGMWAARFLIEKGEAESLTKEVLQRIGPVGDQKIPQRVDPEIQAFFTEIVLEALVHVPIDSLVWDSVLDLVPTVSPQTAARLVDVSFNRAVESPQRMESMLDWSAKAISSQNLTTYKLSIGAFFQEAAKNPILAQFLAQRIDPFLKSFMDELETAEYFEVESSFHMLETLIGISSSLETAGAVSLRKTLQGHLLNYLQAEMSHPHPYHNHYLKVLRLARAVGVDRQMCDAFLVDRIVSSESFYLALSDFLKTRERGLAERDYPSERGLGRLMMESMGREPFVSSFPARENALHLLAVVRGKAVREFLLRSFESEGEPTVRLAVGKALESHFENAASLLQAVHKTRHELLEKLWVCFPGIGSMGTQGFSGSIFTQGESLASFVHNMHTLDGSLQQSAMEGWTRLDQIPMVVPLAPRESGTEVLDYFFPFPKESLSFLSGLGEAVSFDRRAPYAVVMPETPVDPATLKILQERLRTRQELLKINETILTDRDQMKGQLMTRLDAERILSLLDEMYVVFSYLRVEDVPVEIPASLEKLEHRIKREIQFLNPQDPIAPNLQSLILELRRPATQWSEVETVPEAVNYMHQEGLRLFDKATKDSKMNAVMKVGEASLSVANMTGHPLVQDGRFVSKPLRILSRALEKIGSFAFGKFVVVDDYLFASIKFGVHSAEVVADISSPDNGGQLKIFYSEGGNGTGNRLRVYCLVSVMKGLGMRTEFTDDDKGMKGFSAVLDKNHGAGTQEEIERAMHLAVRCLFYTANLDWTLSGFIRKKTEEGMSFDEAEEATRQDIQKMAGIYIAEESLPFFNQVHVVENGGFWNLYQEYLSIGPQRERLRGLLNDRLTLCGLSGIPEDIPFGQAVIDSFYSHPLEAAVARGEVDLLKGGPVRASSYDPVSDLASEVLARSDKALKLAARLEAMGERLPFVSPLGGVGQLKAVGTQWGDKERGWMILRGLVDTETRKILYAWAEQISPEGKRRDLSSGDLSILFPGQDLPAEEPEMTEAQRIHADQLLRAPPRLESMPGTVVRGLAVSQGTGSPVTGVVTFDRDYYKVASRAKRILFVPFTTPDDYPAIEGAGGLGFTHGLRTNHAAITTREREVASVRLLGSRWVEVDGRPILKVKIHTHGEAIQGVGGLWIVSPLVVEERDIVPGTLVIMDGKRGVVSFLSGSRQMSLYHAWRDLAENKDPEDGVRGVVREMKKLLTEEPLPVLLECFELFLFFALWDKSVPENTRVELVRCVESLEKELPGDVQSPLMEFKMRQVGALLERANDVLLRVAEISEWETTVSQIQATLESIRRRKEEARELAELLSIENPIPSQLSSLEIKSQRRIKTLQKRAWSLVSTWENKEWGTPDLPEVRRVLLTARKNGLDPEDPRLRALSEKENVLTKEKRRLIREAGRWIYSLEEVDDDFVEQVGGKFSSLGEIKSVVRSVGAEIPPALQLSTDGFIQYLKETGILNDYQRISSELDGLFENAALRPLERESLVKEKSLEMRKLIGDHPIPPEGELGKEILRNVDSSGLGNGLMAVRSSAVQEDTEKGAFAGAANTEKFVGRDQVLTVVNEIWQSFWLFRSVAYRADLGIRQVDVGVSVGVQKMVFADSLPVLFTTNFTNGKDEILMSAVLGQGDSSGREDADEYVARKPDGVETSNTIVRKTQKQVRNDQGMGTMPVPIAAADQKNRVLTPDEVRRVALLAIAVENYRVFPRNLEAAFQGSELFCLQDRPMTTGTPVQRDSSARGAGWRGKTSDIFGPFTQPLKRFERLGWAMGPVVGLYYLCVGFVEEGLFRGVLGHAGVSLTSLAAGEGWGLLFGVGIGLFLVIEIVSRSAARMRTEGILPGIFIEELRAEWAHVLSSFPGSRLGAAVLFTGVYLGVAHFLPGFELLAAGLIHALWDMRAAWGAYGEKVRLQKVIEQSILPQFRSLGVSEHVDRALVPRVVIQPRPESAAQNVAVSFLFGTEEQTMSLNQIESLLTRGNPGEASAFLEGLQFKSPAEMGTALRLLEEVGERVNEWGDLSDREQKQEGFERMRRLGVSLGFLEKAATVSELSASVRGTFSAAVLQTVAYRAHGFSVAETWQALGEGLHWGMRMGESARVLPHSQQDLTDSVRDGKLTADKKIQTLSWIHVPRGSPLSDQMKFIEVLANEVLIARADAEKGPKMTVVVFTDIPRGHIFRMLKKTGRITDADLEQTNFFLVSEKAVTERALGPDGQTRSHYIIAEALRAIAWQGKGIIGLENIEELIKEEKIRISLFSPSIMDWRLGEVTDSELKAKLPIVIKLLQVLKGMVVEVATESLSGDIEKEWLTRIQA
jgi:hypothetical protein